MGCTVGLGRDKRLDWGGEGKVGGWVWLGRGDMGACTGKGTMGGWTLENSST